MKQTSIEIFKPDTSRFSCLVFGAFLVSFFLFQTIVLLAVEGKAYGSVASDNKPANFSPISEGHPLFNLFKSAEEIKTYVDTKVTNQDSKRILTNHLNRLYSEIDKVANIIDKDQVKKTKPESLPTPKSPDLSESDKINTKVLPSITFMFSFVAVLLSVFIIALLSGRVKFRRSRNEEEKTSRDVLTGLRIVGDIPSEIGNIKGILRNIENKINKLGPSINSKKIEPIQNPVKPSKVSSKDYESLTFSPRPEADEMTELYNSKNENEFRARYDRIRLLGIANSSERKENPNIKPIFDANSSPSLWGIQSEGDNMIVFPRMGIDLNSAHTLLAYAIDAVYNWNGNPTDDYKVLKPAILVQSGNGWTVDSKGEIEFY